MNTDASQPAEEPKPNTRFAGRHFGSPLLNWHFSADGATLHIEDVDDPELWANLVLNFAMLKKLVEHVIEVREYEKILRAANGST